MAIIHDFSDFPAALHQFAIDQICQDGIIVYDEELEKVQLAHDESERTKKLLESTYGAWKWWVCFETGVEALVKATFLQNEISLLKKNDHLAKGEGGSRQLTTPQATKVYRAIKNVNISAIENEWLDAEFTNLKIDHPFEINTGTLGEYLRNISLLEQSSNLNESQAIFLKDALIVLSDVRRNVDAHVFLKNQVAGNMHGDRDDLYIPAINILLSVYKGIPCDC